LGRHAELNLLNNYQNPFNTVTTIKYCLPKNEFAVLKVYDILGREVTTLVNKENRAGPYEAVFNGSNI
jgi:hypothetical protein